MLCITLVLDTLCECAREKARVFFLTRLRGKLGCCVSELFLNQVHNPEEHKMAKKMKKRSKKAVKKKTSKKRKSKR